MHQPRHASHNPPRLTFHPPPLTPPQRFYETCCLNIDREDKDVALQVVVQGGGACSGWCA
jgi:hypothetical protein